MFLDVKDSSNKKEILKKIKEHYKEQFINPVYFIISKEWIYIFEETKLDKNSFDFRNLIKALTFLKNNLNELNNTVIFFEFNDKLSIIIKENGQLSIESEMSLEIASFLAFYEKYSETAEFYYISTHLLVENLNSIKEIYELDTFVFVEIKEDINPNEIELISTKVDLFSEFKNFFKPKEETKYTLFLKKYKKELILGSIVLLLASGGFYGYKVYEEKKAYELEQKRIQEMNKKRQNFKNANQNYARVQKIEEFLNRDKDLAIASLNFKGKNYSTYLSNVDNPKEFNKVVKVGDNLFYVEGTIKTKNKIKNIKDIRPINLQELFILYNNRGFYEKNMLVITKEVTRDELDTLLDKLKSDNLYSFDIFIQKSIKHKDNYNVYLTVYKIKKPMKKKKTIRKGV